MGKGMRKGLKRAKGKEECCSYNLKNKNKKSKTDVTRRKQRSRAKQWALNKHK